MRDFSYETAAKATRPKRSRAKRDIHRPYPPDYVDREEIAYRLRVSIGTIDNWIARNLFPPEVWVFGIKRWRWTDIQDAIDAQNLIANDSAVGAPSEPDPFLESVKRVASTDE